MKTYLFENGMILQFDSLGAALEWAHKNGTRIVRVY